MKINRVSAVVAVAVFAVSLHAARPSGGSSSPSSLAAKVTSTVHATGLPAPLIESDAVISGSDSYVTSKTAGTTSQFMSDGEWNVASGTKRSFHLDLGEGALFSDSYVNATIFTYCTNYGLRPVASLQGVGDSTTCPMLFRIGGPENPTFYRLAFNSFKRPGAGDVTFTCEAVKSATDATCTRWSGHPADNDYTPGDGRSTARLYKVTSATRTSPEVEEEIGDYEVVFQFSIVRP